MATVTKSWAFVADSEGLADSGSSPNITFSWLPSDGSPSSGCAKFATGTLSGLETEKARRTSTGETWETWGVPPNSTVDSIQVTAWKARRIPGLPIEGPVLNFSVRIIGVGGASVTSADGDIISNFGLTTLSSGWNVCAAGPTRNVDSDKKQGGTDVRLELQIDADTSSYDLLFDSIDLTITYTVGGLVGDRLDLTGQSVGCLLGVSDLGLGPLVLLAAHGSAGVSLLGVGQDQTIFYNPVPASLGVPPLLLTENATLLLIPVPALKGVPGLQVNNSSGSALQLVLNPVGAGATVSTMGLAPTGNLKFRQCRDCIGAVWTTELAVASGADDYSCGGAYLGNKYVVLYSKGNFVYTRSTITPLDWSGSSEVLVSGITGHVHGIALANNSILCALVGKTPVTSHDGVTWTAGVTIATLPEPSYITSQGDLLIIVAPAGNTVKHYVSRDAGKTWL